MSSITFKEESRDAFKDGVIELGEKGTEFFEGHKIALNGLGYIPLVGTIIGIARVIFYSIQLYEDLKTTDVDNEENISNLKEKIDRGFGEIFLLGWAFIIPDIFFSEKSAGYVPIEESWEESLCSDDDDNTELHNSIIY